MNNYSNGNKKELHVLYNGHDQAKTGRKRTILHTYSVLIVLTSRVIFNLHVHVV